MWVWLFERCALPHTSYSVDENRGTGPCMPTLHSPACSWPRTQAFVGRGEGKECLVHTVCACALLSRHFAILASSCGLDFAHDIDTRQVHVARAQALTPLRSQLGTNSINTVCSGYGQSSYTFLVY